MRSRVCTATVPIHSIGQLTPCPRPVLLQRAFQHQHARDCAHAAVNRTAHAWPRRPGKCRPICCGSINRWLEYGSVTDHAHAEAHCTTRRRSAAGVTAYRRRTRLTPAQHTTATSPPGIAQERLRSRGHRKAQRSAARRSAAATAIEHSDQRTAQQGFRLGLLCAAHATQEDLAHPIVETVGMAA
jgi:hypothetical protein